MKLTYSFEYVDMGDEIIAVPVGSKASQFGGVLKLNRSAQEVMKLIEEGHSVDMIIDMLANKYAFDRNRMKTYVQTVVDQLRSIDGIEE